MSTTTPRMTADQRRAAIVEVAVVEFARRGFEATTTDAVARRAGITQPYVIRLFGTKRDLFLAAVDRALGEVRRVFAVAADTAPPSHCMQAICASYGTVLADRDLLLMQLHAMAAADDPGIRDRVAGHMSAIRRQVADATGAGDDAMREFMATGMLLNAAVALDLPELLGAPDWAALTRHGFRAPDA